MKRKRPEDRSDVWRPRRSLRLYLDQVADLFEVLAEIDPEVRAETDDFLDVANVEELAEIGVGELKHLTMTAKRSGTSAVVVRLDPRDTGVWIASRDDNLLYGVRERLKRLLTPCERILGAWSTSARTARPQAVVVAAIALLFPVIASVVSAVDGSPADSTEVNWWPWVLTAAAVMMAVVGFVVWRTVWGANPHPSATIVLAWRADAPTFWERNGNAILIGVASNVLVGGSLFLLGLWLG